MSNVATVSFKLAPERFTALRAMAESRGLTLSEFVRETVVEVLDLDEQVRLMLAEGPWSSQGPSA